MNINAKNFIENCYNTLTIGVSIVIFSIIIINYFIPKTIWMVNEFPYPTEYYSIKKVIFVSVTTIILFLIFLFYYQMIITKLNKKYTFIVNFLFVLFILISEIMITTIVYNPIVGDYAIIKQAIVSFYEGDRSFLEHNQLQQYPYITIALF